MADVEVVAEPTGEYTFAAMVPDVPQSGGTARVTIPKHFTEQQLNAAMPNINPLDAGGNLWHFMGGDPPPGELPYLEFVNDVVGAGVGSYFVESLVPHSIQR